MSAPKCSDERPSLWGMKAVVLNFQVVPLILRKYFRLKWQDRYGAEWRHERDVHTLVGFHTAANERKRSRTGMDNSVGAGAGTILDVVLGSHMKGKKPADPLDSWDTSVLRAVMGPLNGGFWLPGEECSSLKELEKELPLDDLDAFKAVFHKKLRGKKYTSIVGVAVLGRLRNKAAHGRISNLSESEYDSYKALTEFVSLSMLRPAIPVESLEWRLSIADRWYGDHLSESVIASLPANGEDDEEILAFEGALNAFLSSPRRTRDNEIGDVTMLLAQALAALCDTNLEAGAEHARRLLSCICGSEMLQHLMTDFSSKAEVFTSLQEFKSIMSRAPNTAWSAQEDVHTAAVKTGPCLYITVSYSKVSLSRGPSQRHRSKYLVVLSHENWSSQSQGSPGRPGYSPLVEPTCEYLKSSVHPADAIIVLAGQRRNYSHSSKALNLAAPLRFKSGMKHHAIDSDGRTRRPLSNTLKKLESVLDEGTPTEIVSYDRLRDFLKQVSDINANKRNEMVRYLKRCREQLGRISAKHEKKDHSGGVDNSQESVSSAGTESVGSGRLLQIDTKRTSEFLEATESICSTLESHAAELNSLAARLRKRLQPTQSPSSHDQAACPCGAGGSGGD